jgi:hypothetical protein
MEIGLGPEQGAQWWGCFTAGSQVSVEVAAAPDSDLRVELLDQNFRPIAGGIRQGATWVARIERLERSGFVYVRIRNQRGSPDQVCLMCDIEQCRRPARRRESPRISISGALSTFRRALARA